MADEQPLENFRVPVVWVGADEVPVFFANQFVAQVERGEVFLTVGQLVPPAILPGPPEAFREQAERIQYVPVQTVARIALTPARLQDLIQVLEITKANHEKQSEAFGDPRQP